ncbi:MAG: DNA polymerase III subunit beta [Eubacteriaceae bacterium]|nr:DNA polymerase III subunit beta [Eubacteriaceae bacterium]
MHFTISSQELLKAIATVSKAVNPKTPMPILGCVLIQAKGDSITLKASSNELSITTTLGTKVAEEGELALHCKTFMDLIKTYDNDITISTMDNGVVNVRSGSSEANINTYNAADYPKFEPVNLDDFIVIGNETLKNMLKQIIFCASSQDTTSMLAGILIECDGGYLKLVAIDGFKMAIRKEPIENSRQLKCVVPSKTMSEIMKILSIYDSDVMVQVYNNRFIANVGDTQVSSGIIKGSYINYEAMVPTDVQTMAKLATKELHNSVKRASLMVGLNNISMLKLTVLDEAVIVESESQAGKIIEQVQAAKSGDDLQTAFNAKYLEEILRSIDDERLIMESRNPKSPSMFKPVDSDKYLYLLMPVRTGS